MKKLLFGFFMFIGVSAFSQDLASASNNQNSLKIVRTTIAATTKTNKVDVVKKATSATNNRKSTLKRIVVTIPNEELAKKSKDI